MPLLRLLPFDAALAEALMHGLAQAGHDSAQWTLAEAMAHLGAAALDGAPEQVVHLLIVGPPEQHEGLLLERLSAARAALPGPISLIGPAVRSLQAWLQAGLSGWWPASAATDAQALAAFIEVDRYRWQREAILRADTAQAQEQLDERKWIERAKGVLMQARGIGEDEAFRVLRGASMHTNVRVGEVSRSVLKGAQWGDAINRAGQLRMLSQRLVKLAAQRLAGIDARRARTAQQAASQRAQENLDHLSALPLSADALDWRAALAPAQAAWLALNAVLDKRQTAAVLPAVDAAAEVLLASAEALTETLEQAGGRRALHIVNLCGRQRMRVQRVAKIALMGIVRGQPILGDELVAQLNAFEAALLELEQAPLSSHDIRDALASARNEWMLVLRCLRGDGAAGVVVISRHRRDDYGDDTCIELARASDVLMDTFDRLTAAYEHSLQVIMS